MKKLSILIISLIGLTLFSCSSEKYKLIKGTWECGSWTIEESNKNKCNNNVVFTFEKNQTYTSKIGNLKQEGNYEIIGNQLICTPTGKMKIGVEINKLTSDSLSFTMSRSGQKETLVLLKK